MFNREKKAVFAALELAKANCEQLEAALEQAIAANEALQKRAFIIGIDRQQRMNKFTFMRNGELHQIETMGLISDDIRDWKEKLL